MIKYEAGGRFYPSSSTVFLTVFSKELNWSCPQPLEPSTGGGRERGWGGEGREDRSPVSPSEDTVRAGRGVEPSGGSGP